MTETIPSQRHLFDLPRDVAYLNCAYMSPLLHAAVEAGDRGLRRKARPWELTPAQFFDEAERARALFAGLMGAEAEGVALVPSASYGLAVAARNLPVRAGSRILTLKDQFPSNVYVWREKAKVAGAEVVAIDVAGRDATEAVLAEIDERTALAALPHVLWTSGARLDLVAIGARLREARAALALDLTQSAGAMVCDLAEIRPDFATAASYKWLLGPYATGFLYVAPHRREGRPLEETWLGRAGSEDFARLVEYQDAYQPGARRFDMGERANFALLPALIAALEQLAAWTPAAIEATLRARTACIAERARAMGLAPTPDHLRGPHYLSIALPDGAPDGLPARLAAEGVHVSQRGRSLRVTPHLWNDDEDVERLLSALSRHL
jgi:selenocysteine lyase/cysteine desulfurase